MTDRPVHGPGKRATQAGAGWTIVDRRTNRPVTITSFLSFDSAADQITRWQDRHERGGRPDVTREALLNMEPKLISEALPWGEPRENVPVIQSSRVLAEPAKTDDPAAPYGSTKAFNLALPGDRGDRTVDLTSLEQYVSFGKVINAFQREHPDTLVRTSGAFSRTRNRGSIRVRWWPRGEEMPT